MDDLLADFLIETRDNIRDLELFLAKLDKNPNDKASIQEVFRLVHTIKASCGFVQRRDIETIAHDAESILIRLHHGQEKPAPGDITAVSGYVRHIAEIVRSIEQEPGRKQGDQWSRLPLVAEDAAERLGKKIAVQITGRDTPVDPATMSALMPPLLHLVRNAADHGIEPPALRKKCGKPETGKISIAIKKSGKTLTVDIADDGAGLQTEKIKKRAVESGLKKSTEAAKMTPNEVFECIFAPGFSTAEEVTTISGHGMGMDVVRSNIEKSGGSIHLHSAEGKGCTFTISMPLS